MAERKIAWGTRTENVLIGREIQRIDGVEKVSGRAKYTADLIQPEMLAGRPGPGFAGRIHQWPLIC